MKRTKLFGGLFPLTLLTILSACGKDAAVTGSSENRILSSISIVNAAIDKVGGISSASKSSLSFARSGSTPRTLNLAAPDFGADWTSTTAILDPKNYPGQTSTVSFRDFFGAQLDSDALTREHPSGPGSGDKHSFNALGRMKSAMGILCAIGVGMERDGTATDANGYPTANITFTFTQAFLDSLVERCGFQASAVSGMLGMTLDAEVQSVSGEYDIKIHFEAFNQDYYYRSNANEINILTAERADPTGPTMRTIVAYDLGTRVIRVDYASVKGNAVSAGLEGHRLYYDATNDDGVIFSIIGAGDEIDESKDMFSIAGKPDTGTQFSISGKFRDYQSHEKFEACVNSDGTMGTDGARCSASSTTVVGVDVVEIGAAFSTLIAHQNDTDWISSVTASKTLEWTNKDDMMIGGFK